MTMKQKANPQKTMFFIAIASFLMVLLYLFAPVKNTLEDVPPQTASSVPQPLQPYMYYEDFSEAPVQASAILSEEDLSSIEQSFAAEEVGKSSEKVKEAEAVICETCVKSKEYRAALSHVTPLSSPSRPPPPAYQKPEKIQGSPKIAIIIDDMGMDRKRSTILAQMHDKLTLAFLPYAPNLEGLTSLARQNGHELMIHMPMQAMDSRLNLGSIALREGMNEREINKQLDQAFQSFEGYVGLNNHMGSQLTQNPDAMRVLMQRLKVEGLYFVDSVTIGGSVAASVAQEYGLATARRDVFLDHTNSIESVRAALQGLEDVARRQGYAIAIGHPRAVTIQALQEWMPVAKERGYEFVYVSTLVQKRKSKPELNAFGPVQLQSPQTE